MLAEETEKSLEETQKKLARRDKELQSQEDRCLTLEERNAELTRANQIAREEISNLRMTISSLDREKDSLQHGVDDKTEKMARLSDDMLQKVCFDAYLLLHSEDNQNFVITCICAT